MLNWDCWDCWSLVFPLLSLFYQFAQTFMFVIYQFF